MSYLLYGVIILGYLEPFMCGCVHVDNRWGHMSISWFGQCVQ